MAINNFRNRQETFCKTKDEFILCASTAAHCDKENVRIIKCVISEEEAKAKLNAYLQKENTPITNSIKSVNPKVIHKEYYPVIGTYFFVSEVEYDYDYSVRGMQMAGLPRKRGCSIEEFICVETLQNTAHYALSLVAAKHLKATLPDTIFTDEFESGFVSHMLFPKDIERDSTVSMSKFKSELKLDTENLVRNELGSGRYITKFHLLNMKYNWAPYIFANPFYIFQYDLGSKIITVAVDAYSGNVCKPIVNDPLALKSFPSDLAPVEFGIFAFLISAVVLPVLGGVLYALWYSSKKKKYLAELEKLKAQI